MAPTLPVLLAFRVLQGLGGALVLANVMAEITAVFPPQQRRLANVTQRLHPRRRPRGGRGPRARRHAALGTPRRGSPPRGGAAGERPRSLTGRIMRARPPGRARVDTGTRPEGLYPGCQSDVDSAFYAPLLVLIGSADTVTPARFCQQMQAAQPAAAPELLLVVYPRGPHTFDMQLPVRTVLGMRLGYDADATADARRQVLAFLRAHGLAGRSSR